MRREELGASLREREKPFKDPTNDLTCFSSSSSTSSSESPFKSNKPTNWPAVIYSPRQNLLNKVFFFLPLLLQRYFFGGGFLLFAVKKATDNNNIFLPPWLSICLTMEKRRGERKERG